MAPPNNSLPLTYADIVLDDDMTLYAAETRSDLDNLVQDVGHILVETLGSNPDDLNRGVGIENYLGGTADDLASVVGIIERQLTNDDRISACTANIVNTDIGIYQLFINIQVAGSIISLQFGWSAAAGLIAGPGNLPYQITPIAPDILPQPFILWHLSEPVVVYDNQGTGPFIELTQAWAFAGPSLIPHVAGPGTAFALDFAATLGGGSIGTAAPSSLVPAGNSFSLSVWVYRRNGAGSGSPPLFTHAYGTTWPASGGQFGNGIVLPSFGSGTWQPGFYLVGGGTVFFNVSSTPIPLNTWTHLTVTWDGTTLSAYLNGAFVQSTVAAGAPRSVDWGTGRWFMGGNAITGAGTDAFDGRLYNLRVDSQCLTPGHVAALYALG